MSAPTLLIVPQVALPAVTVSQVAIESKDRVLGASSLIASLKTADDNRKCFEARRAIEGLSRELEKERKKVTDPINDWLRQFKATVDTQRQELEQESGRLAQLEKDFNLAEQRRVFEEQEAQRRELDPPVCAKLTKHDTPGTTGSSSRCTCTASLGPNRRKLVPTLPISAPREAMCKYTNRPKISTKNAAMAASIRRIMFLSLQEPGDHTHKACARR